jgi:Holliday junction resolvase RusA-like endonuclease
MMKARNGKVGINQPEKVIEIDIPGKVKAKERPRRGRYGNFYTPRATQDYEAQVHRCALQAGLKPIDTNIGITIIFYGNYARSDIDNLIKSVLDGFKYFFNDNKVTELTAHKIPAKEYISKVKIIR